MIKFKELCPGIILYDNIFPEAEKYIKEIEKSGLSWRSAYVFLDDGKGGTDYGHRDTDLIILPERDSLSDDLLSNFVKNFYVNIDNALNHYLHYYGVKVEKFQKPQLLKYGKNQKFNTHIDDHPSATRRVSMTFYINDEYTGGEIFFDRFGIEIAAKKNQLLVFPSNYPYSHKVKPVIDGTRYVVVQWIS